MSVNQGDSTGEEYNGPFGLIPFGEEEMFELDRAQFPWLDDCIAHLNEIYDGVPIDISKNGSIMCLTGSDEDGFSVKSILRVDRSKPKNHLVQHDEAASLITPSSPTDNRVFGEFHRFHRRVVDLSLNPDVITAAVSPLEVVHTDMFAKLVTIEV